MVIINFYRLRYHKHSLWLYKIIKYMIKQDDRGTFQKNADHSLIYSTEKTKTQATV